MAYLILVVVGVVSLRALPVDLLPRVEFTQLTVRTEYANVGPEEIEKIITDPIENAVSGLPNLERVRSTSSEGTSRVTLNFARGTDVDEAANDLRAALDRLRDELPLEADTPEILKLDLDRIDVVTLAVTSTRDLEELTRILENDLARRFEQLPGVGSIELRGGIYREIRVNLDRDRLRARGLTALDVRDALARENVTLPGGDVKAGLTDLYVRALGEYRTLDEIRRTVVARVRGLPVRVEDLAEVVDGYEDVRYLKEINGAPAVSVSIQKQSGANTVAVADAILREVARINDERDDLHLAIVSDQSEFIRQSISSVRSSAVWGSLLAIVVLYAFLRRKSSTAIVAVSIPISVISTFGLLYFGGLTLNQMTFGGLALGVGLIVDNAIVVLESIVRKREEQGLSADDASRVGAGEVTGAIVASTLTTCAIFLPLVFARTTSGALFQALALVVVFALACSLVVALTLVPMLAARFLRLSRGDRVRRAGFVRALEAWYVARLRAAIGRRGWVFGVAGTLLAGSILAWPFIPVELTPHTDADEIDVEIEMAEGTNVAVVRSFVDEVEQRVRRELRPADVEWVTTEARGTDAEVELTLAPEHLREVSSTALADRLRSALAGNVPGGEIEVRAQSGLWILRRVFRSGSGEQAVELEIRGWDLDRIADVAAEVRQRVAAVPGLSDVRVSRREGRPEERLILDRGRIAELGLSVQEVGRTIQANVAGIEAGRLRERGDEFPIVVRLRPEHRLTGLDLGNVALRTPAGDAVSLSTVVTRDRGRGPVSIDRVDGQRVTYVTANLEAGVALGDTVERVRSLLADLRLPPESSLYYGGEYQEQLEVRRDFAVAILMALALVYMLMAAQFERFLDPLIVMISVPTVLIGVVPTLLLSGTTLNLQSLMGLLMLVGIVVNNAIVLIDAVNLLRRDRGMPVVDAVLEAGRLRLRPILMTTLTTILGLAPLAAGIGVGAEIQAALARVVIGGLASSTLVTLVLIPVTYVSATGFVAGAALGRWRWASRAPRRAPAPGVEPA
jgi:HAE1 family hydrophobic/amphiphilic exporter-1